MSDSFNARAVLPVGAARYTYWRLGALDGPFDVGTLPFTHKVLLENLLRHEDGLTVTRRDIEVLAAWDPRAEPDREIAFRPARVLMQDFTGVPAVVDLAAMREAMERMGGDPARINPLQPAELVIDHSVQVDAFGTAAAFARNTDLEFQRNHERYTFLRWGQKALANFQAVPPGMGIVHQVNLEYLARTVFGTEGEGERLAYPDTLVGTDSHTTMINGLGVLGWGVGGIEAEAAMLGQPISMLIPQVVGMRLEGELPEGATATDLVLTITQTLRAHGVVGKFVEFFGDGLVHLPLADRATIANMAPEYGATCGIFPIDGETLRFLRLTGRDEDQVALVESYARAQGLWRETGAPPARYTDLLELDLATIQPSLAGPKRPQDRVPLPDVKANVEAALGEYLQGHDEAGPRDKRVEMEPGGPGLGHGAVVIAAITSCTNTSNPAVMLGAGLLAKKANERGLSVPPWVKTSLGPGSRVVTDYLDRAGLTPHLEALGFHTVGYGCTTCIGNSGPLPPAVSRAIAEGDLAVCSVLSGNRNFEGRVHPEVRLNYLASPPLVVAFALAGRMDIDLRHEPLGTGSDGKPVHLRDLWPGRQEIQAAIEASVHAEMFRDRYARIFAGDPAWQALEAPEGELYDWDPSSTYIKHPPYFESMGPEPAPVEDILHARCLAVLGDSVTTDHISPAGAIKRDSPAGRYLLEHGIGELEFNSYGARRGNHEVMMRGTFANIRLRNHMAPGTEGGWTRHQPGGEQMTIFDAAMHYQASGVPLVVLAGLEYGTGSSRDWAAKGPRLLGVRAVIARSYERIHRSNLVGMGILPLQFQDGEDPESLGLTGMEIYDIRGVAALGGDVEVTATPDSGGEPIRFRARVRIDTPQERAYYHHGGILQYVLRTLLAA